MTAEYTAKGEFEICGGDATNAKCFKPKDKICERHGTGSFSGTKERERIFGSTDATDKIDVVAGADIVAPRGPGKSTTEVNVVKLGPDGGTMLLDGRRHTAIEGRTDDKPVEYRITHYGMDPKQAVKIRGFRDGDTITYNDGKLKGTYTFAEIDARIGHEGNTQNPYSYVVFVNRRIFVCNYSEAANPNLFRSKSTCMYKNL